MSDNAESFRNEIVSRLYDSLPQDQLKNILQVLDSAISGYDISRKQVEIIPRNGIPKVIKYFIASKAVENLSETTLKIYRLRLIDFFDHVRKPYMDVTTNDIRMYLFFYQEQRHASDHYRDQIRRELNSFFSWLVRNEYLIRNPCTNVEKLKYQLPTREPLSAYGLEVVRWYCETLREKALVDILYSTGMRVSECSNANLSDIDWTTRSVVIRHGKGNKRRLVFFDAESELSLRKYIESRSDTDDALFVTMRNPHHRLGVHSIENEVKRIASRCDMRVFPHRLRHTFATFNLHGGMPLDKLQALMGHTKPETTMIYAKQDLTDIRMEYNRIHVC